MYRAERLVILSVDLHLLPVDWLLRSLIFACNLSDWQVEFPTMEELNDLFISV